MTFLTATRRTPPYSLHSLATRRAHLTHKVYSTLRSSPTILTLKAEHPSRLWERRTPLVPQDVSRLIRRLGPDALSIRVESSPKRIFSDQAYRAAGAQIVPPGTADADADLILAIKEIPIEHLSPTSSRPGHRRTYCFFSHTHKGQSYNVPLLKKMVSSGDAFVDWELLLDPLSGRRTVSFGRLAGVVGAVEALSGVGITCLRHGISTPFLNLARPFTFTSEADLMREIRWLGDRISTEGYAGKHPLSIVVTGATGRVGQGAVEVLDQIGVDWAPSLAEFRQRAREDGDATATDRQNRLIGYKLRLEDHIVHIDGSQTFDRKNYDCSPQLFRSTFASTVAPWTSLLINGAYWSSEFPRLLNSSETRDLLASQGRMWGVTDISCDFHGGLEFVTRATTIEDPYAYFALSKDGQSVEEVDWNDSRSALQLISIEILPSELAEDASTAFSEAVLPYVEAFVSEQKGADGLRAQLDMAMICQEGNLLPAHAGLQPLLGVDGPVVVADAPRKVILFGSGMVAQPAIETLLSDPRVEVVVASNAAAEAEALCAACGDQSRRVRVATLDVANGEAVSELIRGASVVVSLLPAVMHPQIAKHCIDHQVHLVTASYVSPEMESFDAEARARGLTFLNELGLDPGIDHMSALRLINKWRKEGWRPRSFVSFCGGLPENEDGLLGYRFSWSPRGVLNALKNPARFRLKGKQYEISGTDLLLKRFPNIGSALFAGKYRLEGLANRDSVRYISQYGLEGDELESMMRGTLRYEGFGEVMEAVARLGLLEDTWSGVADEPVRVHEPRVLQVLQGLGILPLAQERLTNATRDAAFMERKQTPIEWISEILAERLKYRDGERDMVLMSHELRLERDGEEKRVRMWMEEKGQAMARTVGSPVGIGALVVLDLDGREDRLRGVVRPMEERLASEVMTRLETCGISLREEVVEKGQLSIEDVLVEVINGNATWKRG